MASEPIEIPSPNEVASNIAYRRDQECAALLTKCVSAIKGMVQPTVTVQVPMGTEGWVVAHVVERLRAEGWIAKHWAGCQRDPANEIQISNPAVQRG